MTELWRIGFGYVWADHTVSYTADAYKGTNQVRHVAIYRLSKLDKLNKLRKHLPACATRHVYRLNSIH
jgi:hypothetical protein